MKNLKNSLIITLVFTNSLFGQINNLEYSSSKYRYSIAMEIPHNFGNIHQLLKAKFETQRLKLEEYQKKRDKSYYSERSVNIPYSVTFNIDSIIQYKNFVTIVYKVIEENSIPGNNDFYFEVLRFYNSGNVSYSDEVKHYLKEDKLKIFKLLENSLRGCQLFQSSSIIDNFIIPRDSISFNILIWKGLLDVSTELCVEDRKWITVRKNTELGRYLFDFKKVTSKTMINLSPNNPTKMYLIKGDEVGILEEQGEWFKIRYYGKKVVEGWIKRSDVD